MHFAALVVAAALASSAPTQVIKLASPQFGGPNLQDAEAEFFSEHLAQQLGDRGVQVVTPKQIATLLGLERQKAMLGCSEDSTSCLAELGDALGADGVLTGEIARFGGEFQINLKVLSSKQVSGLAAYSARVTGEAAVLDELTIAARVLAEKLSVAFKRPLPAPGELAQSSETSARRPLRSAAWLPGTVAAVSAAAAGLMFLQSEQRYAALRQPVGNIPGTEARQLRDQGSLFQTLSLAAGVTSGVALGLTAWFFFSERESASANTSLTVGVGPGSVAVGGSF